ncbi:3-dehydro-L-gulonate 2-dehydrogenase [Cytophaga sp. FL35]|uniref:3-dehydro-L-gulonate 2-dehydrogenase n=1 Tax=Cytophaga sp. FL35 TaxID=1904456 RepID=UPI001653755A|nr:3-dehydro-L-gulonate 2-dehydrogenase [Cytophaga sp. FL35]MBC6999338.1 3-dehydro-L-gulonate 2-dehydrogenase [Cytophaga sp. FL35]
MASNLKNISFEEMQSTLVQLFLKYGFTQEKAELLALTYTESTLDGVNSHGINRVPLFISYIEQGYIQINAEAEKAEGMGSMERWDGNLGPGIINATKCTDRAISLAKEHGMGMVALRNTNHWMRGGTYGRRAAEQGCIAIMFTNTQPNMPPWGGKDSRLGNNPFIVSIPRKKGHVVLDMAISQFAFGKINDYKLKGQQLPFPGGWDDEDQLSTDPEKILVKERGLPIGYWKGSALSMILDMLVTLLSAGNSTSKIAGKEKEIAISQVFLCISQDYFKDTDVQERLLQEIIDFTHSSTPMKEGQNIYYPGERTLENRAKNQKNGMPVSIEVWEKVLELAS